MTFWRRRPGDGRSGSVDDAPALPTFVPPEIDVASYRARVESFADSLNESVDDVTGHALHGLINAWADQWIASMNARYSAYLAQSEIVDGDTAARVASSRQLWMHELARFAETGMAVEATLTYLIDDVCEGAPTDGG
jgi:hypothetical protein